MSNGGIPHPKKTGIYIDFEDIYKEFEIKVKSSSEQLRKIMDGLQIKFIHDTDKKVTSITFDE